MAQCDGALRLVRQPRLIPSADGGSNPSPLLRFREIGKETATALVIEHHYMHRKCPISWAWGIEDSQGTLVGVLTVGKPLSWSVRCSLVGENHEQMKEPGARSEDVYELNRLWLSDSLPVSEVQKIDKKTGKLKTYRHGVESKFIGWCLHQLKRQYPNIILISYADGSMNHVGYVYQATNWIYTGQSNPFSDICVEGYTDYRSVTQELRGGYAYACDEHGKFPTPYSPLPYPPTKPCQECGNPARRLTCRSWAIQNYVTDEEGKRHKLNRTKRSPKHRYVWLASPKDKKLLKWEQHPYPKIAAKQVVENRGPTAIGYVGAAGTEEQSGDV